VLLSKGIHPMQISEALQAAEEIILRRVRRSTHPLHVAIKRESTVHSCFRIIVTP
jgi:chaperonin GroEL (HSP60 family)